MRALQLPVATGDGHEASLVARIPDSPRSALLWLPALGVAAKHYIPFAEAMAERGIAVFLHEWRGNGSSNQRAGRDCDWAYRELFADIAASEAAMQAHASGMPRILGGHSLGGQLACCSLALAPQRARALWLVASGAPYWRSFPTPTRWWLPFAYRFLPWLADCRGALPGRRVGFGGNEARGVIRDWSRTALSGRYAAVGMDIDLERALSALRPDVRAVVLDDDWLAPPGSLHFLLGKMPCASSSATTLGAAELGLRADHFGWLKAPDAVVDVLLRAE
ncbi:alpha/beta fold hydrolase [Pseudoluteimonas lycopersici]|uniref:Alpha/beta fold hydrolase n=1 Tax=Pseudoluteimonas lycopersici TaxID=1324796 RepID=A0A516V2C3_9GAMM|nr:alpha/beta fold hydrolase [Lysobacter lycopersici]QDQ72665.1 alpha/beta fold hydrolase [Lysobacter lycopersici]